jgi:hypothetical protein
MILFLACWWQAPFLNQHFWHVFVTAANSQKQSGGPATHNKWRSVGDSFCSATYAVTCGRCSVKSLIKRGGYDSLATLQAVGRPSQRLVFSSFNHQSSSKVDVLENGLVLGMLVASPIPGSALLAMCLYQAPTIRKPCYSQQVEALEAALLGNLCGN